MSRNISTLYPSVLPSISIRLLLASFAFFICVFAGLNIQAQTTEFTYQGSLKNGGVAATGNYDFEFLLFDTLTAGTQSGSTLSRSGVAVANGTFSVKLDFGATFPGANRFLEIHVRQGTTGGFTQLLPRQPVTSAPYSLNSINAAQLGGIPANQFVQTNDTRLADARAPTAGSTNYIQNLTVGTQASASFNISGHGDADIFNAATDFRTGGYRVLSQNVVAMNVFAAVGAGASISTGTKNSFVGFNAGLGNSTGGSNAFFGDESGGNNQAGSGNSAFGSSAGIYSLGSNNSFFGYLATNPGSVNLSNATAIGSYAFVTQNNSMVLGSINGVNGASADTRIGIGTSAPAFKLEIIDTSNTGLRVATGGFGGTVASFGGRGAFQIDAEGAPGGRFQIAETGEISFNTLGTGGNVSLCRNSSTFQISTCSSSIRYKKNVNPFLSGMSLIKQLRPVSFTWKADGQADMGLVAEEVAAIEPLLTTTNAKGEIEGVKYDRVGIVLVNAVQEQQLQIEAQQKQIDEQNEIIKKQQADLDALKALVCSQNPTALTCKPQN